MEVVQDTVETIAMRPEEHTCSVYALHFPDGRVYVGMTSRDTEDRWSGGHGYYKNKHLYSEIFRVGWENIKTEVLYSGLDWKSALALEAETIAKMRATEPEFGYNRSPGSPNKALSVSKGVDVDQLKRSDLGGSHRKWKHGNGRIGMYNFNGELEIIFDNLDDAVSNNPVGATYRGIVDCITGKTKKHAGKIWRKEAAV